MSGRFSVRPVLQRDLPRILEIEAASFGADAYDRNLFAEYARLSPRLFLVVETRGVCGYSIACILAGGVRAELVSLAVAPNFLGSGAAAALLGSTVRRLRLRGVGRLTLTVKITNLRARRFYEKSGFRKLRRAPAYYEDGADGVLMAKDL
jgi:[ribosomal protein S18]-alanine N-acetyltransferase